MNYWIAAALSAPIIAAAQLPPRASASPAALVERMQANVAQITIVGEKERWQANLAMWQVVVAKTGKLTNPQITGLQASLHTIRTNLVDVVRPAEEARWQENVALWRAYIRAAGNDGPRSLAAGPALARMKANVAKITEPAERERWQANVDLWQAALPMMVTASTLGAP